MIDHSNCRECGMADTQRSPWRGKVFDYECGTHFIPAEFHAAKVEFFQQSKACERIAKLQRDIDIERPLVEAMCRAAGSPHTPAWVKQRVEDMQDRRRKYE